MDTASQFSLTNRKLAAAAQRGQLWKSLENLGLNVSRYGLVITLLLIGALKFTASEAQGIQPLVANSPLMFWLYRILSVQGVSNLIGVIEIVVAVLMASRPFSAKLSFIGSLEQSSRFCSRLASFSQRPEPSISRIGPPCRAMWDSSFIKDLVLLGASVSTASEARLGN